MLSPNAWALAFQSRASKPKYNTPISATANRTEWLREKLPIPITTPATPTVQREPSTLPIEGGPTASSLRRELSFNTLVTVPAVTRSMMPPALAQDNTLRATASEREATVLNGRDDLRMIAARLLGVVGVILGLVLIWGGPEIAHRIVNQWWGQPVTTAPSKPPGLLARVFGLWIRLVGIACVLAGLAHVIAPTWAAHG